jgi:hypothetical protein
VAACRHESAPEAHGPLAQNYGPVDALVRSSSGIACSGWPIISKLTKSENVPTTPARLIFKVMNSIFLKKSYVLSLIIALDIDDETYLKGISHHQAS